MSLLFAKILNDEIVIPVEGNEWFFKKIGPLQAETRGSCNGMFSINVADEPDLSVKLRGLQGVQVVMRSDMQLALVGALLPDGSRVSGDDDSPATNQPANQLTSETTHFKSSPTSVEPGKTPKSVEPEKKVVRPVSGPPKSLKEMGVKPQGITAGTSFEAAAEQLKRNRRR